MISWIKTSTATRQRMTTEEKGNIPPKEITDNAYLEILHNVLNGTSTVMRRRGKLANHPHLKGKNSNNFHSSKFYPSFSFSFLTFPSIFNMFHLWFTFLSWLMNCPWIKIIYLSIYEVLRLFHMTLATGRFTPSDKTRTNCNIAWTKYRLKGRYVF